MKALFFPSTKLNNIHDFNILELTNILLSMLSKLKNIMD